MSLVEPPNESAELLKLFAPRDCRNGNHESLAVRDQRHDGSFTLPIFGFYDVEVTGIVGALNVAYEL